MAWIYQRRDSGLWWIGTRVNGVLVQKSTGERSAAKARQKLAALEAMEAAQRAGQLNRELFEALTGARVETVSLSVALDTWLKEATNPNTFRNYSVFAKQLRRAIPGDPLLTDITPEQVRAFLAGIRAEKRASTANQTLRVTRVFFRRFKGSLRNDPTEGIAKYKDTTKVERETFTPEQIRAVMAIASPFWRCASALAFYTGLRLSNVATLRVGDLNGDRVEVATVKTGAKVKVKIPLSVMAMIREAIPPEAGPRDYVWPDQAKHVEINRVGNLSDQFATLLVNAGIRKETAGAGNGISGRRTINALTFHSLRHSLISALANAGVNQQVVKKFVGHATDRMNDLYTHIGQDTLDKAVDLLPDVTKPEATK
jgi:integrase